MSDIDILRYFMSRKQFQSTYNSLPTGLFDLDTLNVLKWFKYYYQKYKDDGSINVDKLTMLIKLDSGIDKDGFALMQPMLKQLKQPIDPVVNAAILEQLEERRLAGEIALLHRQFEDGKEVDFSFEVLNKAQESHKRRKVKHQGSWEDGDVWQMVQEDADNSGYLLDFLPRDFYMKLKGLNAGDNICIAAPTNKGKTSFLANIAVTCAKQHKAKYEAYVEETTAEGWTQPDGFRPMVWQPVLYLVNEGTSRKITPRIYQTALGLNREKLFELGASGKLESAYQKVLGRRDAIRLVDVHGYTVNEVARVIEQHNPFMVITDMTGRMRVQGGSGSNDVAQLEEAWETMRVQAAIQQFIHVGTVQISAEGFNNYYPPLSAVQNSKTGIQTTWDLAIYIGAMNEPAEGQEGTRGLSTPKSKMARSGYKDVIQCLTWFSAEVNTWKVKDDE